MSRDALDSPEIDLARPSSARVADRIRRLAMIGADPSGGITRLACTAEERQAHHLVAEWMHQVDLEVRVDTFGNTYGLRPGRNPGLPALAFGSHVDTVPNGGAYDGAVGTIGALETMQLFQESDCTTEHPLLMIVFAAEEGARFGKPNLGSRAAVGELTREDIANRRDAGGATLEHALQAISLDPDRVGEARWSPDQISAFLELHIEQGQVLETERKRIGIVESIAGSTRLRFDLTGVAVHSGATPMHLRHDALAAAADLILGIEAIANDHRHRTTVATVGRIEVWPNSITTISGGAAVYVDVRDIDSDRQRDAAIRILELGRHLGEKRSVRIEVVMVSDSSPTILPTWIRRITSQVCRQLDLSYRVMASGAGHDASVVSAMVPAAMIFVPSQGGISHAPQEWSSPEDIAAGVSVLSRSVLALDEVLSSPNPSGDT